MTNVSLIVDESDFTSNDTSARAWLLPVAANRVVAVGDLEMVHLFPFSPKRYAIPRSPHHAHQVIVWQNNPVPVVDLSAFTDGNNDTSFTDSAAPAATGLLMESEIEEITALFAFQISGTTGATKLGALTLNNVPERITVADESMCDPPDPPMPWDAAASSFFLHDDFGPVAILNLSAIFGRLMSVSGER